jgi:hypothetical protein
MAVPLPIAGSSSDPWAAFLRRREDLVSRMEMGTCDGCDGCGLRCMDGFTVTRDEYLAVRAYLQTLPPDEVARVLGQQKIVPWPGAEETGATVTYCRFRDMSRRNCFIYPVRPTVCRLFGHTPWLPCPIEAIRHFPEGSPELWNEYMTFERKTWAEWDAVFDAEDAPNS